MGKAPCCDKANVKRGPWSPEEDAKLKAYIHQHGTGSNWIALPQKIGLNRCGKSCRLRWLNYLRPNIKRGCFSQEEDNIIYNLYINIGSRWSIMASQLPGRTDNDIKNHWNTRLKKKLIAKHLKLEQSRNLTTTVDHKNQEIKKENFETFNLLYPDTFMDQRPSYNRPQLLLPTSTIDYISSAQLDQMLYHHHHHHHDHHHDHHPEFGAGQSSLFQAGVENLQVETYNNPEIQLGGSSEGFYGIDTSSSVSTESGSMGEINSTSFVCPPDHPVVLSDCENYFGGDHMIQDSFLFAFEDQYSTYFGQK